jgi:CYTH domain-containing protein
MSTLEDVNKIVLTGGPCSGKTTLSIQIQEELRTHGITLAVQKETFTDLFEAGVRLDFSNQKSAREAQKLILEIQLQREDQLAKCLLAMSGEHKLLLCDRGAFDGAPFIGVQDFHTIIRELNYPLANLYSRYKAVNHLVTAANGAEAFYNLGNKARTETPEEARKIDLLTQEAWNSHDDLAVISNTDAQGNIISMEHKGKILLRNILHRMGMPVPMEIEKKFLLRHGSLSQLESSGIPYKSVGISQDYLPPQNDIVRRIRRIQFEDSLGNSSISCVYTEKKQISPGIRSEVERLLTMESCLFLLQSAIFRPVHKTRYSFIRKEQYFQLDVFQYPDHLVLLEIEFTNANMDENIVVFPDFLDGYILKEVTDDERYSNAAIAEGRCPYYAS